MQIKTQTTSRPRSSHVEKNRAGLRDGVVGISSDRFFRSTREERSADGAARARLVLKRMHSPRFDRVGLLQLQRPERAARSISESAPRIVIDAFLDTEAMPDNDGRISQARSSNQVR